VLPLKANPNSILQEREMNFRFLIVSFFPFFLFWGNLALGHDLTNIQFRPPSPASLDWEERIYIDFDWQTE
jgi:hypothetical protein